MTSNLQCSTNAMPMQCQWNANATALPALPTHWWCGWKYNFKLMGRRSCERSIFTFLMCTYWHYSPCNSWHRGGDTNIQLQKLTVNLCMGKGNKLKGVRTMGKTSNLQTSEGRKQKTTINMLLPCLWQWKHDKDKQINMIFGLQCASCYWEQL